MKTRIINLIGASGSGKTTLARLLERYGYNIINSYTTRKPRHEEEWGHIFIEGNLSECGNYIETKHRNYYKDEMIAYFYNYKNHYFALEEQIAKGKTNIYVIDPLGAEEVKEHYKDTNIEVVNIFLQVDEQERAERLAKRLPDKTVLNVVTKDMYKTVPEIWSRLGKDRDIFSLVKADYVINANGKEATTLDRLLKAIKESE